MASSSPVASEKGTTASFSLVGTDVADGEDYMLLDMPTTEAAPAEVEPEFVSDPTITKETLANQLMEMEKVMSELGLESKSGVGAAAHGSKAPPGFVSHLCMFSNQGPLRMVFRPLRDLGPGLFFRRQAGPYIDDVGGRSWRPDSAWHICDKFPPQ